MLAQHANDLILGKSASPHHSSPSDELTYQWHDFWGARQGLPVCTPQRIVWSPILHVLTYRVTSRFEGIGPKPDKWLFFELTATNSSVATDQFMSDPPRHESFVDIGWRVGIGFRWKSLKTLVSI
jgi:hypothetical protein